MSSIKKIGKVLLMMGIYLIFIVRLVETETLQITTYYPAPYGAYASILTTRDTYLARDGGNVGIGTTNPEVKLDVIGAIKWGTYRGRLIGDQGASIELGGRGTPYIDFSNDMYSDYDMRIILTGDDELTITGGRLRVAGDLLVEGRILGLCTVVSYPWGWCPSGMQIVGFRPSGSSVFYRFYALDVTGYWTGYQLSTYSAGQYICCRI